MYVHNVPGDAWLLRYSLYPKTERDKLFQRNASTVGIISQKTASTERATVALV